MGDERKTCVRRLEAESNEYSRTFQSVGEVWAFVP